VGNERKERREGNDWGMGQREEWEGRMGMKGRERKMEGGKGKEGSGKAIYCLQATFSPDSDNDCTSAQATVAIFQCT